MTRSLVTFDGVRLSAQESDSLRAQLNELVMAWASDRDSGAAKYILEVETGRRCNCICPACGDELIAVNSRNPNWRKRPHFRHSGGTETEDCSVLAAREALLRTLRDLCNLDGQTFELPGRTRTAAVMGLSGTTYTGTASSPAVRYVPESVRLVDAQSAVIRLDDGREVLVQVVAALERSSDVPAEHRAVIQIVGNRRDLASLASVPPDELRARLQLLLSSGEWCRHWDDEALNAMAIANAAAQAKLYIDSLDQLTPVEGITNYESALHLEVKLILADSKTMRLPGLMARVERDIETTYPWVRTWTTEPWCATFSYVRLENRLGRVVPDVVTEGPDGLVCIEVTVTNPLDSQREERYEELGVAVLEIDLREFCGRVTRDQLREIVVDGLRGKRWVYHPLQVKERRRLLEEYETEVGRFKRMQLRELRDEARDRALAYYDSDFDPALEPPLLELLRALESRGFAGAASHEFYGHAGLLPRLMSIALARPVGYHVDSVFQVVNAIAQSKSLQWAILYLMALKVYAPPMPDRHRAWVAKWRRGIVERARADDPAVNRPTYLDKVIGLFFPDLIEPLTRPWRLRQVSGKPTADHEEMQRTLREQANASSSHWAAIIGGEPFTDEQLRERAQATRGKRTGRVGER